MSPLRQRMIDEMKLRNFSVRTQQSYVKFVESLAVYYNQSPDKLTCQQVQNYILHLINDKKLAWNSCNVCFSALKFFYYKVLQLSDIELSLPKRRKETRLPQIYSKEEIEVIIGNAKTLRDQALLKTTYAAGLRVSELIALKITDIDKARMNIRVKQGKGKKDRYTLLPNKLLEELKMYWKVYKPAYWMFPVIKGSEHISVDTAQKAYYKAVERAGIKRKGGIHTLRHSFATHLLEADANIKQIQMLLGHASIKTTMRYLHLTTKNLTSIQSPYDSL